MAEKSGGDATQTSRGDEKNDWKRFLTVVAAWAGAALFVFAAMEMFLGGAVPYVLAAILGLGAAHIAFVDRTKMAHGSFLKRGVALLFVAFAVWTAVPDQDGGIPWQPYAPELLEAARKGGRPVMIDFRASWCGPCREMDRKVFARGKIANAASPFLALQADLTNPDEKTRLLAQKFNVQALPTIVFLGPDGAERSNLRLVGFERAEDFLVRLQRAR